MVDFGESTREITFNENKQQGKETVDDKRSEISTVRKDGGGASFIFIERTLMNLTKDSGDNVRMRCEVRGDPVPKIRWYKNEAPLEQERGKVEVRKYTVSDGRIGSRLRINHVDIHDTGYYKCEASNDWHTVETTGILVVKAGRIHSPSIIPDFPPPFPHFPALGGR
ncbi:tyrosine-protein kinase transmembrane receptor ROR2-like isoform X2 [Uloborus diversus]|nr:tyrosine-protein kinase transmembrane receptor ROR2-like isoform X2 [Uloborus diversus]